jgi:hypothetical protein
MKIEKSLLELSRTDIQNYEKYDYGFSFTTLSELAAYKTAYQYQPAKTVVRFAPNVNAWLVQIYTKDTNTGEK